MTSYPEEDEKGGTWLGGDSQNVPFLNDSLLGEDHDPDSQDDEAYIEQLTWRPEQETVTIDNRRIHMSSKKFMHLGVKNDRSRFSYECFRNRFKYYVPIFTWAPQYDWRKQLAFDMLAGLSVAIIVIPQCIAFASLAHLPPAYGLYACIVPLIAYAVLGTSKHMAIGAEATSSILIGQAIMSAPNTINKRLDEIPVDVLVDNALALTMMVGMITLLMGLLRLGYLDNVLSIPILVGFVMAVAITLIIEQMETILGLPYCTNCDSDASNFDRVNFVFNNLEHVNGTTLLISSSSLAFMLIMQLVKKKYSRYWWITCLPEILFVVVTWILLSYGLDLHKNHDVEVLGSLSTGLYSPSWPHFSFNTMSNLLPSAFTITMLGFVESQLVTKKYASKYDYGTSANRELVALGAGNVLNGLFGGYAAFGSLTRTKVNDSAGATSQIAGLVVAALLVLTCTVLLPAFEHLPKAVTGSIIISVALSIIEWHEMKFVVQTGLGRDIAAMVGMVIATLALGVDTGLLLGFAVCLLLVVKQTTLPGMTIFGRSESSNDPEKDGIQPIEIDEAKVGSLESQTINGMLILKVEGPLFFANCQKLHDSVRRVERFGDLHVHPGEAPSPLYLHSIVFDMSGLTTVDSAGALTLLEMARSAQRKSPPVRVCFVRSERKAILVTFMKAGLVKLVGAQNFFMTQEDAIRAVTASR